MWLTQHHDQRAMPGRLEISLSQGAKWKALINKYIRNIPVSGDPLSVAEQSISDVLPPLTAVSSAMIKKVGAAARDSKQSALALGHSRRRPTLGSTKSVVLEIISPHLPLSHGSRHAFSTSSCATV
jgi:hypothetical protein